MSKEESLQAAIERPDGGYGPEAQVAATVRELTALANEQSTKRSHIEKRWLKNLRAYHGIYEPEDISILAPNRSRVFIKLTKQKCNAWIARLSDLLFPVDEDNWAIKPTPVPQMTDSARRMAAERDRFIAEANAANQAGDAETAEMMARRADRAGLEAVEASALYQEAHERAMRMANVIRDRFVESDYVAECRKVIADGVKLGTGILGGPFLRRVRKTRWDATGVPVYEDELQPFYFRVDPWSFYPDMDAASVDEAEFFFVRHLLNRRQLRRIAAEVGFSERGMAKLLAQEPTDPSPTFLSDLRNLRDVSHPSKAKYHVWCYYGPLKVWKARQMFMLEMAFDDVQELLRNYEDNDDIDCIVWFANGILLKAGLHPLDSGRSLFSVFNFDRDDSSIFGIGCPELMEGSQQALNSAFRAILDNAAVSSLPQIFVDSTVITPEDGSWQIMPGKIWKTLVPQQPGTKPMDTFEFRANTQLLDLIVARSLQFADDETNMPIIAQGEQAAHVTQTAHGMSLLINSASVVFRRVVRNWDDGITVPTVQKSYEWEMQFNPDESIKGDMKVHARGSSVLLAREVMAQNMATFVTQWAMMPQIADYIKVGPALKEVCRAMNLPVDLILRTDEEVAQIQAQRAQTPPPPTPEEAKIEVAKIQAEARLAVAETQQETAMMTAAEQRNMARDQAMARRAASQDRIQSAERMFAAEAALERSKEQQQQQETEQ